MSEVIRNRSGEPIAIMEDVGTRIILRDYHSRNKLGEYDKQANITRNANHSTIGYGNQLMRLLPSL